MGKLPTCCGLDADGPVCDTANYLECQDVANKSARSWQQVVVTEFGKGKGKGKGSV